MGTYKRYQGNSGRVTFVEEARAVPAAAPEVRQPAAPRRAPGTPRPAAPETEDLLLLLILYLLYRESGDSELLMIIGAMLFL